MSTPMFSVTTDDARYYRWPRCPGPDIHPDCTPGQECSIVNNVPSITTVKKQGVPNPVLQTWAIKRCAVTAIEQIDLLMKLRERSNAA